MHFQEPELIYHDALLDKNGINLFYNVRKKNDQSIQEINFFVITRPCWMYGLYFVMTKRPGPKCQGTKRPGSKCQGVKRQGPVCQGAKRPAQNVRDWNVLVRNVWVRKVWVRKLFLILHFMIVKLPLWLWQSMKRLYDCEVLLLLSFKFDLWLVNWFDLIRGKMILLIKKNHLEMLF